MKIDGEKVCNISRQLLDIDLPHSSIRLLQAYVDDSCGFEYGCLCEEASLSAVGWKLQPDIYFPAVYRANDIDATILLRAKADLGKQSNFNFDKSSFDALKISLDNAHSNIDSSKPPLLTLINIPADISIRGPSLGLAALLSFLVKYTGHKPDIPVIATGEVDKNGRVRDVGETNIKIDEALKTLGRSKALILVPSSSKLRSSFITEKRIIKISSAVEAIEKVFNKKPPLRVNPDLVNLNNLFDDLEYEYDHEKALQRLRAFNLKRLKPVDKVHLLFRIGSRLRHLGRSEEALKTHIEARELLETIDRRDLGNDRADELVIDSFQSEADIFENLEDLENRLRQQLSDKLSRINEIRCRGTLALVLSKSGKHTEAINLRERNLEIQKCSEELEIEIPRTLSYLVWESARGGNEALFEKTAKELFKKTRADDEQQWRYNYSYTIRGLILLGKYIEAVSWVYDNKKYLGRTISKKIRALDFLFNDEEISLHPEISTAGALIKALKKTGRIEDARTLSSRINPDECHGPLIKELAVTAKAGKLNKEKAIGYY